tara:strand:+ start:202 stop:543 length:342 start_codon:yes stop_codon:yes gene_type:complete
MSYEDMKRVVTTFDWSSRARRRLKQTFNVCDSLSEEKDKRFRLWQSLNMVLWENQEAVDMGFRKFARKHFNERLDALHYHDKNCNKYCEICAKLKRWNNERKESRIHKKPLVV